MKEASEVRVLHTYYFLCLVGPRGYDGVPGERGDIGPQGISIAGADGIKGYPGIIGDHGPTGMNVEHLKSQ